MGSPSIVKTRYGLAFNNRLPGIWKSELYGEDSWTWFAPFIRELVSCDIASRTQHEAEAVSAA